MCIAINICNVDTLGRLEVMNNVLALTSDIRLILDLDECIIQAQYTPFM